MKPNHKKIFVNKASASTKSDDTYANVALVTENGIQMNNSNKTWASMMTQMNSTNVIMYIVIAGIAAYIFLQIKKK